MSTDGPRVTIDTLRAILVLLDQCKAHVVTRFGPDTAPQFTLERARRDVTKAIRLIRERTKGALQ